MSKPAKQTRKPATVSPLMALAAVISTLHGASGSDIVGKILEACKALALDPANVKGRTMFFREETVKTFLDRCVSHLEGDSAKTTRSNFGQILLAGWAVSGFKASGGITTTANAARAALVGTDYANKAGTGAGKRSANRVKEDKALAKEARTLGIPKDDHEKYMMHKRNLVKALAFFASAGVDAGKLVREAKAAMAE